MSGGRGGRRPDPAVDASILDAAAELLVERGFDLTFDDVAARAGVGRTSVFRRYATKRDLVVAAAESITIDRVEVPDTGSLDTDLSAAVTTAYTLFSQPRLQAMARHALAATLLDQEGGAVLRTILARRLDMVTGLLDRAVARGDLAHSGNAPLVADLLSGVIMARLASGAPLPRGEDAERVARALAAAAR
ncbi:TetR/AcrR family transcriptional regulator [Nocardiopsis sp. EMB25]|uniref:TetR/AcrR family transcriptional regulator n=1 Tax=Nocardiopsis sp. EMB25 TaxID=2835867 RepID=UPI002284D0DA|nr:TetR/AcrR family transcriptional regulator [Nocardiopsis sp. EMB25]MCY9784943.1 TetR/AcrR family transcriptional regulator [Nocardiopsis sp. EMB25]